MKNVHMVKFESGLVPADSQAEERLRKMKQGAHCMISIVMPRNFNYHRRWFALLNFAFDYWEPLEEAKNGLRVAKDFERFRKEVIIMAGYRKVVARLDGSFCYEAESISFGSMDEETFQGLYKSSFTVLWDMVLSKVGDMTKEDVDNAVAQLMDLE